MSKKDEINEKKELENESVTREINLDELYDGAVNNTVIIDPVTKDEMFVLNKKINFTIVLVVICILTLLVLYYINNKTNLINEQEKVKPNVTTTTTANAVLKEDVKPSGSLSCKYNSKSDTETQFALFDLVYEKGVLKNSNYNYNLTATGDNTTTIIEELKTQYESLYINNSALKGNIVTFEKDDMNFSLNILSDYTNEEFQGIVIEEGKTLLFVPVSIEDSYEDIKEKYEAIGFSCSLLEMEQ